VLCKGMRVVGQGRRREWNKEGEVGTRGPQEFKNYPGSISLVKALATPPPPPASAIWQFSFRFLPVFPVFWVSGNLETWKGNIY
jgi:hypothetical protein